MMWHLLVQTKNGNEPIGETNACRKTCVKNGAYSLTLLLYNNPRKNFFHLLYRNNDKLQTAFLTPPYIRYNHVRNAVLFLVSHA